MTVSYIYTLLDPRDGEVRYVGQSIKPRERLTNHLCEARSGAGFYCYRWMRELLAAGARPEMVVVEEVPRAEVNEAEQRWIKRFRELGARLTNLTDGGGGLSGYELSPAHVAALVAANKGKRRSDEARANIKAGLNRPEARAAMSAAAMGNKSRRGQVQAPEEREKRRLANTGKKRSEEFCERMRQNALGKKHTHDARQKMSEAKTGRKQTEEHTRNSLVARLQQIPPERRKEIARLAALARWGAK